MDNLASTASAPLQTTGWWMELAPILAPVLLSEETGSEVHSVPLVRSAGRIAWSQWTLYRNFESRPPHIRRNMAAHRAGRFRSLRALAQTSFTAPPSTT